MKTPGKGKVLGFERMEDRLALSAAPIELNGLNINFLLADHVLDLRQGGFVLWANAAAADNDAAVVTRIESTPFVWQSTIARDKIVLNIGRDIYPLPEVESTFDASGPSITESNTITPIPQPGQSDTQQGGTIELTTIFLPTSIRATSDQPYVREQPSLDLASGTHLKKDELEVKEPSLARARDIYFEVASLTSPGRPQSDSDDVVDEQSKLKSGKVSAFLEVTPATDAMEKAENKKPLPAIPADAGAESSPEAESNPTEIEAASHSAAKTQTEKPHEKVEAAENDEVLAAHDEALKQLLDEELTAAGVALSVRTNEGGRHSATLPVAAVLVGGGLMARHRVGGRKKRNDYFVSPKRDFTGRE